VDVRAFTVGTVRELDFVVSEDDQLVFSKVSGDVNPLHLDAATARTRGLAGPVVFGGLLIAKLSQLIGTLLDSHGLWSSVRMDFRSPLLVGEPARLTVEISQASESTRTLVLRATIRSRDRTIATGGATATLFPRKPDAGVS
jgi:3-hydroxybutyryl-CoA dehydratase